MKKEIYSNADDCLNLSILLGQNPKLLKNIRYITSRNIEVVEGKYYSFGKYDDNAPVLFNYLYNSEHFCRLSIKNELKQVSLGQKLAVLSDFYEVMKTLGKPSLLYTIKDDNESSINIEWIFKNKSIIIDQIKNNSYFEDCIIDQLIIFKDKENHIRNQIEELIDLPYELINIVEANIEDYIYYKTGNKITYPNQTAKNLSLKPNKIKNR